MYGTIDTLPLGKENLYARLTGMLMEKRFFCVLKYPHQTLNHRNLLFDMNMLRLGTCFYKRRGNSLAILNPFV